SELSRRERTRSPAFYRHRKHIHHCCGRQNRTERHRSPEQEKHGAGHFCNPRKDVEGRRISEPLERVVGVLAEWRDERRRTEREMHSELVADAVTKQLASNNESRDKKESFLNPSFVRLASIEPGPDECNDKSKKAPQEEARHQSTRDSELE